MKRKPVVIYTYTALDILLASPNEPTPIDKRTHQLSRMWQGLAALETAPEPSTDDWRVCSDAVNLLETLVDMRVCEDSSGLLMDAVTAMAQAGQRHIKGQALRLSGQGMQAVRAVLEDYAAVLEQIPHRTALDAHRRTERRIHEISSGRRKPHDVEVMKL
jgi:transposase